MRDDDVIDKMLRDAMAADTAPKLSSAFDARVMRRVRPRRLTGIGRAVMAAYVVIAAIAVIWFMRDLPVISIAVSVAIGALMATGASAYGRRLAFGQ